MRAAVLRSVAVIGLGVLILAAVLYVASTVDGRAPEVATISLTHPMADEPDRALITTSIAVEFTEAVDQESAIDALSIEPDVPGSVSWSGSTMIFTPTAPLEPATAYRVSLGRGIRDLAGNRMTSVADPFEFETAGPPTVVLSQPKDGADDVGLDGPIEITFSNLMDTASVEAALLLRPSFAHELRWSGTLLEIVPNQRLDPDQEYEVRIGRDAFDVAGVPIASPFSLAFQTVAPGLDATLVVPADRSDGIAAMSPIAVFFDEPIDAGSVSGDALTITPEVAGTIGVVDALGEDPAEPTEGTVLRFQPSGALPANTTFEVVLGTGITGLSGGGLAEPVGWSFTTGSAAETLSNQVAFISDRSGIANLWAMNPDGSAQRQLSAELTPVLDYAVAPDGGSFVVADGRQLVLADASGADREILTQNGVVEFDPTFAPDGTRIAFARADAETGAGLGLWEWTLDGGSADRVTIEVDAAESRAPSASASDDQIALSVRAPRYSPDGTAVAFVDLTGTVGIVDLETDEVERAQYEALAPPAWLPSGDAVLVTGRSTDTLLPDQAFDEVVGPLEPTGVVGVAVVNRPGAALDQSAFGAGATLAAIASDGRIAYLRPGGVLRIADDPTVAGAAVRGLADERIGSVSFAPGEEAIVVVVTSTSGGLGQTRMERVELPNGDRSILSNEGRQPRWLP